MPSCEKCWEDAYLATQDNRLGQTENYQRLIKERKDNPCSPKEQAMQYWDEKSQTDTRRTKYKINQK